MAVWHVRKQWHWSAHKKMLPCAGKGEDGTAWQPRLERLANARALSSFEKNMLLLLVGYHVSPRYTHAVRRCAWM